MSKIKGLPQEGDEARSMGPANENEMPPAEQRAPQGNNIPKTDGPRLGKGGEYLPAEYEITREITTAKGDTIVCRATVQDR